MYFLWLNIWVLYIDVIEDLIQDADVTAKLRHEIKEKDNEIKRIKDEVEAVKSRCDSVVAYMKRYMDEVKAKAESLVKEAEAKSRKVNEAKADEIKQLKQAHAKSLEAVITKNLKFWTLAEIARFDLRVKVNTKTYLVVTFQL